MFTAFVRLARADTFGHRLHSGLIFLVVAAATAAATLTLTIFLSAAQSFARLFEAARGAHVWFTAGDPADLAPLRALAEVVESIEPFPSLWGDLALRRGSRPDALALWGLPAEALSLGRPVVVAGRWLSPDGTDEIVLDAGFGRARGIQPGEQIEIGYAQESHLLTVVGLAANAARPAFPVVRPGLGYVLPATLERLEPDRQAWAWMLGVRLTAPDSAESFIARARAAYPPGAVISATPWQWVRDEVWQGASLNLLFLGVFSVFVLAAAGLVITNLAGGQAASRTRQIGLLKAIGITPGQVTALLVLEQAGLGGIAAAAGGLAGLAVAPRFLADVAGVLGAPPALARAPLVLAGILTGATGLLLSLTVLPAWRAGRLSTVHALAPRATAGPSRYSWAAGLALRQGWPVSAMIGVKDLFSRPLRTTLTFSSLLLAVVSLTFTLGVESTLRLAESDPTRVGLLPYAVQAVRTDAVSGSERLSHAETIRLIEALSGVSAHLTLKTVPLQPLSQPGQAIEPAGFVSFALGGSYPEFRWAIADGRMFSAPGEAVITGELADQLGVRVGDEFSLRVMKPGSGFFTDTGKRLTLRIVGRYVAVHDGGRRLLYGLDTFQQQVDPAAEPDRYGLKLEPGVSPESIQAELQRTSGDRLETLVQQVSDGVGLARVIVLGMSATLLMIAGVNLLTALLFAVRERFRDFGILKTLGVTPAQIVTGVIASGSLLGLAAAAGGTVLGLGMTRVLFDVLGEQLNVGRGVFALPSPAWLMAVGPATLALVILGSAVPAGRAARVRVVDVLHEG